MRRFAAFFVDGFRPGLKPRGHEEVLYATTAELIASLPPPGGDILGANAGSTRMLDPEEAEGACDREVVETYLRTHRPGGAS